MYKKLLLYISIFFIYILIGCSTNKTDLNPTEKLINLEKITVSETVYSIEDFEKFGFKVSKSYKIKNLPSANGAWYGFWIPPEENSNGEFVAFEIRSYPSHELAVKDGKFFADEVSGPKGKLKSSEVIIVETFLDLSNLTISILSSTQPVCDKSSIMKR